MAAQGLTYWGVVVRVLVWWGGTVQLAKDIDMDEADVGETVTVTLTVTNTQIGAVDAAATATGVEVVDTLPAGLAFVSGTDCAEAPAGVVTCTLADIVEGGTGTATFTATVENTAAGTLTNTAVVSADQCEAVSVVALTLTHAVYILCGMHGC